MIDYFSIPEAAKILMVTEETIQRWIDKGLIPAHTDNNHTCVGFESPEELKELGPFVKLQKYLSDCQKELRQEIINVKRQTTDLKLKGNANTDINHLNKMSAIVMSKMWKAVAKRLGVDDRDAEMVELAMLGCSSSYIAKKMMVSATSVQGTIRAALEKLEFLDINSNLLERINGLEKMVSLLTHENELLHQNVETLKRCNTAKRALEDLSDDQQKILMTEIIDSGLPSRIAHAMTKLKKHYVIDIVRMSEKDMLSVNNVGRKSIRIIKRYLEENSLKLGMNIYMDEKTNTAIQTYN